MVENINHGLHIYGPDVSALKRKMATKRLILINNLPNISIPKITISHHLTVHPFTDFFFVHSIPLVYTIPRN